MSNQKFVSIIRKLIEKTDSGELDWETTEATGTYQVSFPRFSVRIFSQDGDIGPDIHVQVISEDGSILDDVKDGDLSQLMPGAFTLMSNLLQNARRCAMGVDAALDALLKELTKDDIPF